MFLFILSAIGIGLMISYLAVTQQQGLMGAFLFMVPAIILSGFTTPIANMPVVVQKITLLNPLRYFMVVIRGVFLENAPFHVLINQYWPMAIIGFVNLIVAGWLFRHRIKLVSVDKWSYFPLDCVLRGFPAAAYIKYASPQTAYAALPSEKIHIYGRKLMQDAAGGRHCRRGNQVK